MGLSLSKICTPCWISCAMTCLEWANASAWAVVHSNCREGCKSSLKGAMAVVMLNVYETWFTSPNQERTSVRFLGVGNSEIARTYFLHGLTVVSVISKPDFVLSKAKFLRVEGDIVSPADIQPLSSLPVCVRNVARP